MYGATEADGRSVQNRQIKLGRRAQRNTQHAVSPVATVHARIHPSRTIPVPQAALSRRAAVHLQAAPRPSSTPPLARRRPLPATMPQPSTLRPPADPPTAVAMFPRPPPRFTPAPSGRQPPCSPTAPLPSEQPGLWHGVWRGWHSLPRPIRSFPLLPYLTPAQDKFYPLT